MSDLVDPNWYEYTYPEENNTPEYMRLDVIVEGALEQEENFTPEDVDAEWETQVEDLQENCRDKNWSASIYDERTYPPERVRHLRHIPSGA